MMFTMHALGVKDEVGEGQRQQLGNLGQRPVVANGAHAIKQIFHSGAFEGRGNAPVWTCLQNILR